MGYHDNNVNQPSLLLQWSIHDLLVSKQFLLKYYRYGANIFKLMYEKDPTYNDTLTLDLIAIVDPLA